MDIQGNLSQLQRILFKSKASVMDIVVAQSAVLCLAEHGMLGCDFMTAGFPSPYREIMEYVRPILSRISERDSESVMTILEDIISSKEDYKAAFEENLRVGTIQGGHDTGIFAQPQELTDLVCRLAGHVEGKIYNPFAGMASYAPGFNAGDRYYGEEIEPLTWCLGVMRMLMSSGNAYSPNFIIGDSTKKREGKFSCIVSTPPYGLKVDGSRREDMEEHLLKDVWDYLEDGGTYIGVHSPAMLFRQNASTKEIRCKYTLSGMIDTVIFLPPGIQYSTSIASAIIILKKGREDKPVTFLDASECCERFGHRSRILVDNLLDALHDASRTARVPREEIEERGFNWSPNAYIMAEDDEEDTGVKLCDVVKSIRRVPADAPSEQVIKVADLTSDPTDILLKIPAPADNLFASRLKCTRIDEPALLLFARRGISIRMGYVMASPEQPVFVNMNIIPFKVDGSKVTWQYLALELSGRKLRDFGASSIFITKDELLQTPIRLIPLAEQTAAAPQPPSRAKERRAEEEAISTSFYNVITCGTVDTSLFEDLRVKVLKQLPGADGVEATVKELKGQADALIYNPGTSRLYKITNVLSSVKGIPTFILTDKTYEYFERELEPDDCVALAGRIFQPGSEKALLMEMRKLLDIRNTPEAIIRNRHRDVFDAARMLDDFFKHDTSIYDVLSDLFLDTDDSKVAGDFCKNARIIRDNLIGELKKVGAVPEAIDPGGIPDFFIQWCYKAKGHGAGAYYYLTRQLVPIHVALGLQFITRVCNKDIHSTEVDRNTGFAIAHCLMSFILWFRDKVQGGFFDSPKTGLYWILDTHNKDEFVPSSVPLTVDCINNPGKDPYYFCENIHIGPSKKKKTAPRTGMRIIINNVVYEAQPLADAEGHRICFFSTDWEEIL